MKVKRILFKDRHGNQLVESKDGKIGVRNEDKVAVIEKDFRSFVKENKLSKDIKFLKKGNVFVSNRLLGNKK